MSYDFDNVGDPIIDGIKLYCDLYEKSEHNVKEVLSILLTAVSILHVKQLDPEEYELGIEMFCKTLKKAILMLQGVQEKN
jgi:hypothetical protein